MTQSEIKSIKEQLFKTIEDSRKELEKLRKICTHPKTFVGKYSWRPGRIDNAEICEDCGELIKVLV